MQRIRIKERPLGKLPACEMDEIIGARLRKVRKKHRLTQTALGEKIGVRYQQVQKYETGQNKVSATMLKVLCEIFEVTPNYFYGAQGMPGGNDNECPELVKAQQILADMPAPELRGRAIDLLEAIGRTWKSQA